MMHVSRELALNDLRRALSELLATEADTLAVEWMARLRRPADDTHEARVFLDALLALLSTDTTHKIPPPTTSPALFRLPAQLALVDVLLPRFAQQGIAVTAESMLSFFSETLAVLPDALPALFSERLSHLSQLSWTLNGLRSQDAILQRALQEAPRLVGAESSAVWLWDADQRAPVMLIDAQGPHTVPKLPSELLRLLRQTAENACAYSIDAGETDAQWPARLRGRPVAFLPLPVQHGCLGIMSVQQRATGAFTHDDIFLLSVLGSHVATAITNAQLHESERHLVNLLQTSIRQVVKATSRRQSGQAEFVESLVQVAEGLTHGELVFAALEVGEGALPLFACSGARTCDDAELAVLGAALLRARRTETIATLGTFTGYDGITRPAGLPDAYMLADILIGEKTIGVLVACGAAPLDDEQQAFLQTMAVQIGAGVESIEQSTNIERMLFQLSNINYVSDEITSTFDPRRIMSIISMAASQALTVPIVLAGWHMDDGAIRVFAESMVGVGAELLTGGRLTDNNAVIRKVLDSGAPVTSRSMGGRAARAFPMLAELAMQDWVCVPMLVKGRARGIILVGDTAPRAFNSREIALVSTYANQAALAMENSLLVEQVERQLQQMELLYRISRSFSATLEESVIQAELLHVAREALQVPVAMVCVADPRTGVQRVAQVQGIPPTNATALQWESGRGIIGTVHTVHASVVSMNLAADGRDTLLRQLARDEELVSALAVPMLLHAEALGTLLVATREAREFSQADQSLLQAIATEAAAAIRNARIHQEATRAGDHLREVMDTRARNAGQLFAVIGMLETARAEDPPDAAPARMRQRLAIVAEMQARLTEDSPDLIDVHDAVTELLERQELARNSGIAFPTVVTGARLLLPVVPAALLTLCIFEQLTAIAETREEGAAPDRVVIGLHQLGLREMLLDIEDTGAAGETRLPRANPAIIHLVRQELHGSFSEIVDGGIHHVRFRFPRPAVR